MSPTIAIDAIRGDCRFEQRYGGMYYAVNRHWPEVIIANSDRAWRAAEAMAAGLPVVATDVGDIRRLVAEGVNGFVVTCDQQAEHSMTSALTRLLTDPGLRSRMSAAARSRAQSEFSLSQLADQVLIAYDKAGWKQKLTGSKAALLLNSPA